MEKKVDGKRGILCKWKTKAGESCSERKREIKHKKIEIRQK